MTFFYHFINSTSLFAHNKLAICTLSCWYVLCNDFFLMVYNLWFRDDCCSLDCDGGDGSGGLHEHREGSAGCHEEDY